MRKSYALLLALALTSSVGCGINEGGSANVSAISATQLAGGAWVSNCHEPRGWFAGGAGQITEMRFSGKWSIHVLWHQYRDKDCKELIQVDEAAGYYTTGDKTLASGARRFNHNMIFWASTPFDEEALEDLQVERPGRDWKIGQRTVLTSMDPTNLEPMPGYDIENPEYTNGEINDIVLFKDGVLYFGVYDSRSLRKEPPAEIDFTVPYTRK